jgi:ABC-type nitrate/sulfonate/bicarbonate transport system permease component
MPEPVRVSTIQPQPAGNGVAESHVGLEAPAQPGQLAGRARRKRQGNWLAAVGLRLLPFAIVVGIWSLLSASGVFDPELIPAPWTVAVALWDGLVTQRDLWGDVGITLYRAVTGLVIGAALGLVVGVAMGQWKWVATLLDPLISFAFPMPKLALLPLLLVILGVGDSSLIVMVTLGAFFPMIVNTYAGVSGVSRVLLWNARTLGAGRLQQLRTVVLPASLPHVLSGVRIASGVAFLLVVAAEMISASSGLGYMIIFSERNYRPDLVIAGIILTAALGFIFDRAVAWLSGLLLAWQDVSAGA